MNRILFLVAAYALSTSLGVSQPQLEQGKQSLKARKYADALASFHILTRLNPKDEQAWYFIAKTYGMMGMLDSAVFYANKAKALNDEDPEVYVVIAESQLAMKSNYDAIATVKAGLKARKDFEPLVRVLGQIYLAMDSTDAATVAFTKAQDANPNDPYVYEGLGDAYLRSGVSQLAISNYEKSVELDSTQSRVLFKLARTQFKEKQWNAAAQSLQKVVALDPTNDDARIELADMYFRAKQFVNAARWYQPFYEKHPNAKDQAVKYMESLFMSRQYKEVIPVAEKLLKNDPKSEKVLRELAYANVETKNPVASIEYYKKLSVVDTLDIDDLKKLAKAYLDTKKDSMAAATIEEILKKDSTNSAMLAEAGTIYMKMGSYAKAAPFFEKRISIEPNNFYAHYNYAGCMYALLDFESASKSYKRAIELNPPGLFPQIAAAQLYMSECYLRLKMYPESKKAYEDLIKMTDTVQSKYKKQLAEANKFVGLFLLIDKKYEEAVKNLKKSVDFEDNDADAHLWLGEAYQNLQNKEEQFPNAKQDAIKEYKKALKIDSKNKEAKKFLEMLEPQ